MSYKKVGPGMPVHTGVSSHRQQAQAHTGTPGPTYLYDFENYVASSLDRTHAGLRGEKYTWIDPTSYAVFQVM